MRIEGPVGSIWRVSRKLVPTASQANGALLWAFRNPSATISAYIYQVRLSLLQVGAPTAAIEDNFSLTMQRAYIAADATGGVLVTPSGGKNEITALGGTSQVTLHESNVAAGLSGGGSRGPDASPFYAGSAWVPAAVPTAAVQPPTVLFDSSVDVASGQPILVGFQRGFIITCDNALGTASGIILRLDLVWGER